MSKYIEYECIYAYICIYIHTYLYVLCSRATAFAAAIKQSKIILSEGTEAGKAAPQP